MFAYCRNNPTYRKDSSGTAEVSLKDDDPDLIDEDKSFAGGKTGNGVHNPWGRPGGPAHQSTVSDIREWLKSRGISVTSHEPYVRIEGGLKNGRYGDIGINNSNNGQLNSIVQVGQINPNGTPVSREMQAIYDFNLTGYTVYFVPYNVKPLCYFTFTP